MTEQQTQKPTPADELWKSLRTRVAPIDMEFLAPHLRLSSFNSATRAAAAANAAGSESHTAKEYAEPRVEIASTPDDFFDSYSLVQRLDVVNEDGLPFVPFVQPLSLRQFQLLDYGMLLSDTERTVLLLYPFVPPVERKVRQGTSTVKSPHHGIDIKHNVPSRFLLPHEESEGEDGGSDDNTNPFRAKFGEGENSDNNNRERVYHAFLLRVVEDQHDGSAFLVPEFRMTFVNRGTDDTHLGASFVCTGCYACANKYFDIHTDLRQQRDFYTQLPYYSRFTADRFEPLKHREEIFALWKKLTGSSILADGTPHPQIGDETNPVCGYPVEDYQIEEELKKASTPSGENGSGAGNETQASRTVHDLPPSTSTTTSMMKKTSQNKNSNSNNGVGSYLKTIDVSGSARHAGDHSIVDDPDICDAVAVTAGAIPIPEVRPTSTGDFIVRRTTYTNDRMEQRVLVEARKRGPAWREHWEAMCNQLGLSDDFTQEQGLLGGGGRPGSVSAARIVLRDTRSGENVLEDGEISAFVPSDAESNLRSVYNDEAEEQLRLWITKALISAEAYGIHLCLLPIDIEMILSRCIGLLFDNDGGYQKKLDSEEQPSADVDGLERERARRRIIKIVVDAVEDFVQFSGVLWRVVLYMSNDAVSTFSSSNNNNNRPTSEEGQETFLDELRDVSDYSIACGMLSQQQNEKRAGEDMSNNNQHLRPSTGSKKMENYNNNNQQQEEQLAVVQQEIRTPSSVRAKFGTDPRLAVTSPLRQIRPQVVSSVTMTPAITESPSRVREGKGHSIVQRSVILTESEKQGPAGSSIVAPEYAGRSEEVRSSSLHGLYLDDKSQRELFERMDVDHSGTVSLKEISDVLLKKSHKFEKTVLTSRGTIAGRALHEGSFSAGNVLSPIDNCGVPIDEKHVMQFLARKCHKYGNKMTFEEFSVMLLELARR